MRKTINECESIWNRFSTSEKAIDITIKNVERILCSGFIFFKTDSLCNDRWCEWVVEYIA